METAARVLDDLYAACIGLAQRVLEEQTPGPIELGNLAKQFYGDAIHHLPRIQVHGYDAALLVQAVRYVAFTHAASEMKDPVLFRHMLECVMELAAPLKLHPPAGRTFMLELKRGIDLKCDLSITNPRHSTQRDSLSE
jgi:hypothetical protein